MSRLSILAVCSAVVFTAVTIGSSLTSASTQGQIADVLDTVSSVSPAPAGRPRSGIVSNVARLGDSLIAVGPRGLILVSRDAGAQWQQVAAPVSTDLVSVKIVDEKTAWAVGHDAVALRSNDAGSTWERVLDGRSVLELLQKTYREKAQAGDAGAEALAQEIARSAEQSATPGVLPAPFLDVAMNRQGEGFLVGAFGLVLHTADHGRTWAPWFERVDNDSRFHLYGVTMQGDEAWAVGEQGLLLKLDRSASRLVAVKTPYAGTYFGVDVRPGRLLAYGLRGNVYMSRDGGTRWDKVVTGVDANLVATLEAGDGHTLLVSQAGHVLELKADKLAVLPHQVPLTAEVLGAAVIGRKGLVFAQVNGLRAVELATLPLQ